MHGRPTDESAGDRCARGLTFYMCFLQSLDGDTLSVIENPAAVEQRFNSGNTAGASGTEGEPGWLKGTQTRSYSKTRQNTQTVAGWQSWKPLELWAQWQGIESSLKASAFILCINDAPDSLVASGVTDCVHDCHFSSQTTEAVGSCVCSWTPGRLRCRCLVSRWVTVLPVSQRHSEWRRIEIAAKIFCNARPLECSALLLFMWQLRGFPFCSTK